MPRLNPLTRSGPSYRQKYLRILFAGTVVVLTMSPSFSWGSNAEASIVPVPYVYIWQTSGQMGGGRGTSRTTYISASGTGQMTTEESHDVVREAVFTEVEWQPLIRAAETIRFSGQPLSAAPGKLPEYLPASVNIEIYTREHGLRLWSGDASKLPADVSAFVAKARQAVSSGSHQRASRASRYIRSSLLAPRAVEDMKQAGILTSVSIDEVKKHKTLFSAIAHPRMLVEVSAGDAPYGSTAAFSHGRSVNLSIGGTAFQVRNLIVLSSKNQKEE